MNPSMVTCPGCRAKLPVSEELFGKKVRCGSCSLTFVAAPSAEPEVRSAARPVAQAKPSSSSQSKRREDDEDRPVRKRSVPRRNSRQSANLIGIVAAMAACLFLFGSIGIVFYFTRTTDRPVSSQAPLEPVAALPVAGGPPAVAAPLTAVSGKELSADILRKVKAATVRIDVTLSDGEQGSGSGFLIHPEGLFVTNAHVIGYSRQDGNRPARNISIVLNSGERDERRLQAVVFGADGDADLALLRVPPGARLPEPLPIGPANHLRETQELYVFGFPLGDIAGKEITVSTTTISSLRKENGLLTAVQVNGGMHPGNSGGPLTDRNGQVVAVAVAGIKGTSINFAIPGDQVEPFVRQQIADGGKVKPASFSGRSRPSTDSPPFLPPTRLRPPFFPPGFPNLPRGPFDN